MPPGRCGGWDSIRVDEGPVLVGSGKSFTPLSRMHWANLRAACCSALLLPGDPGLQVLQRRWTPRGCRSLHAWRWPASRTPRCCVSSDEPFAPRRLSWRDVPMSSGSPDTCADAFGVATHRAASASEPYFEIASRWSTPGRRGAPAAVDGELHPVACGIGWSAQGAVLSGVELGDTRKLRHRRPSCVGDGSVSLAKRPRRPSGRTAGLARRTRALIAEDVDGWCRRRGRGSVEAEKAGHRWRGRRTPR